MAKKGQVAEAAEQDDPVDEPQDEILEIEFANGRADPRGDDDLDDALADGDPREEDEREEDGREEESQDDDLLPAVHAEPAAPRTDKRLIDALAALNEGQSEISERLNALDKEKLDLAENQITANISTLEAQRLQALEAGDMAAFSRADSQLAEARIQKDRVVRVRAAMEANPRKPKKIEIPAADDVTSAPTAPNYAPAARTWMSKNRWFTPGGTDEASVQAVAVSGALKARGIPVTDPRHYEELDKQMSKLQPKHYRGQNGQRRPAASPSGRRPTAEPETPKNKVVISPRLRRNFELAGLDTSDPKTQQKMARAVRETNERHGFGRSAR